MADTPQEVQTTEVKTGTTKIGFGQLSNPTPMFVTWIFRTEFLINKAFSFWLASQTSMDLNQVKTMVLWATLIDGFVWGIGRFVGVSKDQMEGK